MMRDNIKILGMHGITEGEYIEFNVPENFRIQGFITNKGDFYCVNKFGCFFPMLPSKLYTKKELKIHLNFLRRKEKLEKLNDI